LKQLRNNQQQGILYSAPNVKICDTPLKNTALTSFEI
jgi:hypothetical protein